MTWTYNGLRDEMVVTYGGENRVATRSVAAGSCLMSLDCGPDPIRVIIRQASRFCPVETMNDLEGPPRPGENSSTAEEAAKALGVKVHVIRNELLVGGMPGLKTFNSWRIRKPVLDLCREILNARQQLTIEQKKD